MWNSFVSVPDHYLFIYFIYELPHDKTNNVAVRPAKTQICLGIRPLCSESSLCAQWVAKDATFLHADSEDSDQTGRICPVWSESSLCAQWVAKDATFLHADSEDWSDWADAQADLSLRWAHSHFVCFVMRRLIFLHKERKSAKSSLIISLYYV